MGGIFSGSTDRKHTCKLIIPKDSTRARPTDDQLVNYVEKYADVEFNSEKHSSIQAFTFTMLRDGFGYDSVDAFDPELAYIEVGKGRLLEKQQELVIGKYTRLGDLINKKNLVFICYLMNKNTSKSDRSDMRKLVRKNSRNSADLTAPAAMGPPDFVPITDSTSTKKKGSGSKG